MKTLKRLSAGIGIGLVLLSLFVCSQAPEDGGYYLDPDKYVGTWTLETGEKLEKLILTEDAWIYVKGNEHTTNQGPVFVYDQGGKGTFEITQTTINLNLDEIWACTSASYCGWYAKGTTEYDARAFFQQETVPYTITDTTLTVTLGSGPQAFTKP